MTSRDASPASLIPAARLLERPFNRGARDAAESLNDQLLAAGVGLRSTVSRDERGESLVRFASGEMAPSQAQELARLLRKGMKRAHRAADSLLTATRKHHLEDFPDPTVRDGRIVLGEISVTTADRLANILGAPPQPDPGDIEDWPEAQLVVDRLDSQIHRVTGEFLHMDYLAWCQRCGEPPAISLGDLSVKGARRLASALHST